MCFIINYFFDKRERNVAFARGFVVIVHFYIINNVLFVTVRFVYLVQDKFVPSFIYEIISQRSTHNTAFVNIMH